MVVSLLTLFMKLREEDLAAFLVESKIASAAVAARIAAEIVTMSTVDPELGLVQLPGIGPARAKKLLELDKDEVEFRLLELEEELEEEKKAEALRLEQTEAIHNAIEKWTRELDGPSI